MYRFIVFMLAVLVLYATSETAQAQTGIVLDRDPKAVIVVDKNAPEMVQFAAKELQKYIHKSTSAQLAITDQKPKSGNVIYVGESSYTKALGLSTAKFKPDQFRVVSGRGWLALFGREKEPSYHPVHPFRYSTSFDPATGMSRFGETGALYAVYDFLDKQLGIRFYMPGELGEVVPNHSELIVSKLNYSRAPDIPYRNIYWNEMYLGGDENLWYRRAGFGSPEPVVINHSFHFLNKYQQEHPEYFSIIDGERDFNKTSVGDGSLCLTNPGTLQAFVKEAQQYFKDYPSLEIFPVMPNDGWDRMCECEECQKYLDTKVDPTALFSNYVWTFVNKVAVELAKTNPDKKVGCCAYSNYLNPPANIEKLNPNIAVMICKARVGYWDKEYKQKVNHQIDLWQKKTSNIYIWEYYLAATGYEIGGRGLPIFFPSLMSEDYKRLKNVIKGEFIEGESWVPYTTEQPVMSLQALISPNFYITGKLLWDTGANVRKLTDQYCRDMYGPGAGDMRRFWAESERLWLSKGPSDKTNHFAVYSPRAVNSLMSHVDKAISKTVVGTKERRRIEALKADMKPTFDRINNPLIQNTPKLEVSYAKVAPVIDGNVDEAAWEGAAKMNFIGSLGESVPYATQGMLKWDENYLYAAFINEEPNPSGMLIEHVGADADFIWDDEVIEIFFRDDKSPEGAYNQFIINAGGSVWDAHFEKDLINPQHWNGSAIAKTATTPTSWVLEVAIPRASLGMVDAASTEIRANFYRSRNNKDIAGATRSCWSPNISANFNAPERMGHLTFKK